jgi:hypothetical protein
MRCGHSGAVGHASLWGVIGPQGAHAVGIPVLLTLGFPVCTTMLADLAGLRTALEREYRERDPAGIGLTPREIALMAPPGSTPWRRQASAESVSWYCWRLR